MKSGSTGHQVTTVAFVSGRISLPEESTLCYILDQGDSHLPSNSSCACYNVDPKVASTSQRAESADVSESILKSSSRDHVITVSSAQVNLLPITFPWKISQASCACEGQRTARVGNGPHQKLGIDRLRRTCDTLQLKSN